MRPDPRPVQLSTVLARSRTLRAGSADAADCAAASLTAAARGALPASQVGTKGWSYPIEQRDLAIDFNPTSPVTMTNLLNLMHTTGGSRLSLLRSVRARGAASTVRPTPQSTISLSQDRRNHPGLVTTGSIGARRSHARIWSRFAR